MTVSAATRRFVRERAQRRYEYCHADERWQFVRFTTDHAVTGGRSTLSGTSPNYALWGKHPQAE
jgi:hypothetical protein